MLKTDFGADLNMYGAVYVVIFGRENRRHHKSAGLRRLVLEHAGRLREAFRPALAELK